MSQLGAPEWFFGFCKQKSEGFFVEVGCADAIRLSNTKFLEEKGWRGICIDAFPTNFNEKTRPRTVVERACVYSTAGKQVTFFRAETPELSGIGNHIVRHAKTVQDTLKEKVSLVTVTLTEILDKHQCPSFVDFLSIDTEGSEFEILKGIDTSRYQFGCICVEHNFEDKRADIAEWMKAHGYRLHAQKSFDDWYIRI